MGIRLGIATSNSRSLSEACLEHLGIRQLFDAVVTGDDVDRGKPNPEIYLKAAAGMGVPPEACLVFEDVVMGLQAGILAGMKTCGVHDEMSVSAEQKKRSLADYYIMSFVELLQEGE
jgi:16S rRNA pseudouridine516 synthase